MKPNDSDFNEALFRERITLYNQRPGARVGDWLYVPNVPDPRCEQWTRFTYRWDDMIQTGGERGSFYLGKGYCSYSGGLDSGIALAHLAQTDDTKDGNFWFFDQDIMGAGRGVSMSAPCRVFIPTPDADLSGIGGLRCPWHLSKLTPEQHGRTCGYWYTITKSAVSETAFRTMAELFAWLDANDLHISRKLDEPGGYRLDWGKAKL